MSCSKFDIDSTSGHGPWDWAVTNNGGRRLKWRLSCSIVILIYVARYLYFKFRSEESHHDRAAASNNFNIGDLMEEKISFDFEVEHFDDEDDRASPSSMPAYSPHKRPKHYKEIVCWLWLENLCTKDDATCNFLHRYDESRMPICRNFVRYGECLNRQHCVYKHTNQEVKECIM